MGKIGTLVQFTASTKAKANEVNSNFDAVKTAANTYGMWTDTACTVTTTHTYTAAQTFTGGWTAGAGCTISAGGLTVVGNSVISGTLTGISTLSATTLAGTLSTAAQPNVTSLGTLSSVAVSGATTLNGVALTWPGANATGILKNNGSGTLSWDTTAYLTGTQTNTYFPKATGTGTLTASTMSDDGTTVTLASRIHTLSAQPACTAYTAASVTVTNSAGTPVLFTATSLDRGPMWDQGNGKSSFTVPTGGGGLYLVTFSGKATIDAGTSKLTFTVSGAAAPTSNTSVNVTSTTNGNPAMSAVLSLTAGQYVEVSVNTGGNNTCTLAYCWLSIAKIA